MWTRDTVADMELHSSLSTYSSARVIHGIVFTSGKVGLSDEGVRPEVFAEVEGSEASS